MTKIYTRTGDSGETSLLGGVRVSKDNCRIEAIGAIDELNAALGVVRMELTRSGIAPVGVGQVLAQAQHRLFDIGAELALPAGDKRTGTLNDKDVSALETAIDHYDEQLQPLRQFILPGGAAASAHLHLARCDCRRAERRLVTLSAAEPVRSQLLRYVNRLSDLLFVLARFVNQVNRVPDVPWEPDGQPAPATKS